ncbi:MAG: AAA family ATPase [Acidobacteria bacterium]|nr:AAA family ATPase [Acidobacteriota bacterium]
MSDRVQQAFGLAHQPFDKDIPVDLLWMDQGRQQALDRLVTTVQHHQHAIVLGESGVGKTCVQRALHEQLSPVHYRVQYVVHVTLGPRDFYRQLCYALGIEPKANPRRHVRGHPARVHLCRHRAPRSQRAGARRGPDATLGHLHLLTNFRWDSEPLLSLVLVGLPELHDRMRLGVHRSLLTRIHTKVDITPGSPEMTAAYVRKRLEDAGAKNELFTADALAVLHELCGGLLRSIDVLALAALRLAAEKDLRLIDRDVVRQALHQTPLG